MTTNTEIKTWQSRCNWHSTLPATTLMVDAMKVEIAELRAALASQRGAGELPQDDLAKRLAMIQRGLHPNFHAVLAEAVDALAQRAASVPAEAVRVERHYPRVATAEVLEAFARKRGFKTAAQAIAAATVPQDIGRDAALVPHEREFVVEDADLQAFLDAAVDYVRGDSQNMDTGLHMADLLERIEARLKPLEGKQDTALIVPDWPFCNPGCDYEDPHGGMHDCRSKSCMCEEAKASVARQLAATPLANVAQAAPKDQP